MEVLVFIIVFFIAVMSFMKLAELLVYGLCAAIRFLLMAQSIAVVAILRALVWLIVQLIRLPACAVLIVGRSLSFIASVLFYLVQDCLRGPDADDPAANEAEEDDMPGEEYLFEAALRLLGLPADYTRSALDAAYKKAIRKAHPDTGGSVDQAQAVNAARDILLRRKGWL